MEGPPQGGLVVLVTRHGNKKLYQLGVALGRLGACVYPSLRLLLLVVGVVVLASPMAGIHSSGSRISTGSGGETPSGRSGCSY